MTEDKKGNIFIISEMILWSLFPVVSALGLKGVPGMVSLFWVNLFATFFFFMLMFIRGKWRELFSKKLFYYSLAVVFFINIAFYGLYFFALEKTSTSNVAIIALFEIVPSYLLFQVIRKESFSVKHLLGVIIAVIGAFIVLFPKAGKINIGDLIILCAVFFAPIGNWYQQKARDIASTETALFLRHLLTIPFLFIIVYAMGSSINFLEISNVIWWMILNGVLIFGLSKVFWVEAIHRMTVTKAVAINSLSPVLTILFVWFLLKESPTYFQLLSLPFLLISIIMLTDLKFSLFKRKIA